MASFTAAGNTLVLYVPKMGETIAIAISGSYVQVIDLQREIGSLGSGAWITVKSFDTTDATEAFDYVTIGNDENVRLFARVVTSGTATVTLTDTTDLTHHVILDELGNVLATFRQAGPTFAGTTIYSVLNDGTTDLTVSGLELNYLDIGSLGTGAASKAVVLDSGDDYIWPSAGFLTYGGTKITATGAEVNYLDITTLGTGAASKAMVPDGSSDYTYPSGGTLTLAGTNVLSGANTLSGLTTITGNVMGVEGGVGIAGIALIYKTSVNRVGGMIKTEIVIDLTGLDGSGTDNDIIGDLGTGEAHIGRITAAVSGTIYKGRMTCIELPAGGNPAIALWAATESTGVEDTLIGALTSTELLASGGDSSDWVAGEVFDIPITTLPAADQYLYLVNGDGTGPDAEFSAGIFLIEFWGV